jgi:predicted DNA-binding protein YlxM (UPF0122 family)
LDALPIQRHAVHGTWNYTLRPQLASCCTKAAHVGDVGELGGPAQRRQAMLRQLADPRLTGMTSTELEGLVAALAPAQAARAPSATANSAAGRARRATGTLPNTPLLDDAARLLITLCYQRQVCSMNVLSDLLEVTATCIGDTVKQTREVLQDHGHTFGAAPVRFPTAQALHAFRDTDTRPARTQLHKAAVPPGSDRNQPPRPAATHRTARVPATSPGPAPQLPAAPWPAAGRHPQRRLPPEDQQPRTRPCGCPLPPAPLAPSTMDVLADLLEVCRSSIGNAIRQTRPLLEQAEHTSTPAPTRYHTATELPTLVTPSTAPANTGTSTR